LVKIKARNLAGDKVLELEELDLKKWSMDKVRLELLRKTEGDTENMWDKDDELRLWNSKERT